MQLNPAVLLSLLGLFSLATAAPANNVDQLSPPFPCSQGKDEPVCQRRRDRMTLQRFEGGNCDHDTIGPVAKVQPYKCITFKKKGASSLKWVSALNNKKDRCDTTFFEGKECIGKVVKKVLGSEPYVEHPQCLKEVVGSIIIDNCE